MMGQTSTQYTNQKRPEPVSEKKRFRNLHYNKRTNCMDLSPGERCLAVKEKSSISGFFMCAAIIVQIEI